MPSIDQQNPYVATFERLNPTAFQELWAWQHEVLTGVQEQPGDVAIELSTGAGKTLLALLVCEEHRQRTSEPVAYLTGTKQLTQQVQAEAQRLGVPSVAFHGPKTSWADDRKTDYEFATAVGIMNYWNYLNEAPGVNPAGLVVMDDVHLAEGPLRDFFAVAIPASDPLFAEALRRIQARFGYYGMINDLLDGIIPQQPAEMLSPLDSLEVTSEVGALLDDQLEERSQPWWAWRRTRAHAHVCCWLVSARGLTITPWIPPSQTIEHFSEPQRRLYLSATIGDINDLRRRIGCFPAERVTASVPPRQGTRFVALARPEREQSPSEIVSELKPLLDRAQKALWLCARSTTADLMQGALTDSRLGNVRRLQGDNPAADLFAADEAGQLVSARRYDGMDFPEDACRLEVLPEIPVATSELEEFVSAYLRDAPFARSRFAQRVAQALGRCNRSTTDRAVYLLWDPAFFTHLGNRRGLALLPPEVRADVYAAVRRTGDPAEIMREAGCFLDGEEPTSPEPPPIETTDTSTSAEDEVAGVLRMWAEDYRGAAESFARAADATDGAGELRGFWLTMRALALTLAEQRFGDAASGRRAAAVTAEAISAGGANTFFSRLRASQARAAKAQAEDDRTRYDRLFANWDSLLDRRRGGQLERWRATVLADLEGDSHDRVSQAIGELGRLLGLTVEMPKATQGEHDVLWELTDPRRRLVFEVKLAPRAKCTSIKDVNQAEGATQAVAAASPGMTVRGVLLTPHEKIEPKVAERLDRVRLLRLADLRELASELLGLLGVYADGWSEDAKARERRRDKVEPRLPDLEVLWKRRKAGASPWVALSRRKR